MYVYTQIHVCKIVHDFIFLPCLLLKKVCNIYQIEVRLTASCPNSKVKYMQKVTLKTQFFGHLHLKLKDTCARSKHKHKMNIKIVVPQDSGEMCSVLFHLYISSVKYMKSASPQLLAIISTSSQTAEEELLPLHFIHIANLCFHLLPCHSLFLNITKA